jgi:hypothetical protein
MAMFPLPRKIQMSSELRHELDIKYEERMRKIREAAASSVKELDRLLSSGSVSRAALDAEVARIAQEKLHSHGCDLVAYWMDDRTTRFLIRVQRTGREYDLIKSFSPS